LHQRIQLAVVALAVCVVIAGCGGDPNARQNPLFVLHAHHHDAVCLAFSPNDSVLATGSGDHTVRLWNLHTGKMTSILRGHPDTVMSVAFSPNSNTIVSSDMDGDIFFWSAHTGLKTWTLMDRQVGRIDFYPDGKRLLTSSYTGEVTTWNLVSGKRISVWKTDQTIEGMAFSASRHLVAVGNDTGTITLVNLTNNETLQTMDADGYDISALGFSPNGEYLAAGCGVTKVWDLAQNKLYKTFQGQNAVSFSPSGADIAVADDNFVRINDLGSGKCVQKLQCQVGIIESLTYSNDGKLIAVGGKNGSVEVWPTAN